MKNLGQLMKQAQQMQAKMAELQEKLGGAEITGAAGGGMVSVTTTGKGEVRRVKIDPSLLDPKEVEVLEDLIAAACNDARMKQIWRPNHSNAVCVKSLSFLTQMSSRYRGHQRRIEPS